MLYNANKHFEKKKDTKIEQNYVKKLTKTH